MQKEKTKRKTHPRPNLIKFMVGWVFIWWLALLTTFALDDSVSSFYLSLDYALEFFLQKAFFFTLLSTLQLLWVRRQFGIQLQHWVPLSLLGALAGTVAFLLLDLYVLGPNLPTYNYWDPLSELVPIMRLKYIADYFAHGILLWSLPVMFQWAALRKHYLRHALWLLAAIAHNPFTVGNLILFIQLPHAAKVHRQLGISWGPEAPDSALLLDFAIPSLITGLVLYWILTRRQNSDSAH